MSGSRTAARRASAVPWSRRQLLVAVSMWLLGSALLGLAWNGASRRARLDETQPWIALAGLGGLVVGVGAAVLLSRALRSVRRRQQRIGARIERIADQIEACLRSADRAAARGGENGLADGVLHLPGTTLFHLPDCLLVRGKDATVASREALQRAGHRACGVCRP